MSIIRDLINKYGCNKEIFDNNNITFSMIKKELDYVYNNKDYEYSIILLSYLLKYNKNTNYNAFRKCMCLVNLNRFEEAAKDVNVLKPIDDRNKILINLFNTLNKINNGEALDINLDNYDNVIDATYNNDLYMAIILNNEKEFEEILKYIDKKIGNIYGINFFYQILTSLHNVDNIDDYKYYVELYLTKYNFGKYKNFFFKLIDNNQNDLVIDLMDSIYRGFNINVSCLELKYLSLIKENKLDEAKVYLDTLRCLPKGCNLVNLTYLNYLYNSSLYKESGKEYFHLAEDQALFDHLNKILNNKSIIKEYISDSYIQILKIISFLDNETNYNYMLMQSDNGKYHLFIKPYINKDIDENIIDNINILINEGKDREALRLIEDAICSTPSFDSNLIKLYGYYKYNSPIKSYLSLIGYEETNDDNYLDTYNFEIPYISLFIKSVVYDNVPINKALKEFEISSYDREYAFVIIAREYYKINNPEKAEYYLNQVKSSKNKILLSFARYVELNKNKFMDYNNIKTKELTM